MPTFQNVSGRTLKVKNTKDRYEVVPPGASVQTYLLLDLDQNPEAPAWLRTNDAPYFPIVVNSHLSSPGAAGWVSVPINLERTKIIEVRCTVDCTVHANDETAEGYPLAANTGMQFATFGVIEYLFVYVTAKGDLTIVELEG